METNKAIGNKPIQEERKAQLTPELYDFIIVGRGRELTFIIPHTSKLPIGSLNRLSELGFSVEIDADNKIIIAKNGEEK